MQWEDYCDSLKNRQVANGAPRNRTYDTEKST